MPQTATATPTSPFLFACDCLPRRGTIVDRKGPCLLIEGLALDQGSWFVKHEGGFQKFDTRADAEELIGELAQDAEPEGKWSTIQTPSGPRKVWVPSKATAEKEAGGKAKDAEPNIRKGSNGKYQLLDASGKVIAESDDKAVLVRHQAAKQ
jgi:hypothetical protein